MAGTHDNLDEFFDFAQLEQDSFLANGCAEIQNVGIAVSDSITAMDWQPATHDYTLPSEDFQDHQAQQWPLNNMLTQSLSHTQSHPVVSMWPISNAAIPYDPHQCHEPHNAPSSSISASDYVSLPSGVIQDRTIASGQAGAMSAYPHSKLAADHDYDPPVVRAPNNVDKPPSVTTGVSLPTRHASSASWKPASAKRKGPQSRIPLEARQILDDEFASNPYPCKCISPVAFLSRYTALSGWRICLFSGSIGELRTSNQSSPAACCSLDSYLHVAGGC